ncbi:MAG: insulinase family protein, partial [Anaerolineae bacterium]|nr:insulinase family protein [Anaerolineae bacterium]
MNHQHPLPGADDIARRELPNGIIALARENFTAQSVVITGSLPAGGLYDPPELAGRAAFTGGALLFGTASRDFDTLHETLESIGADLGIHGGVHTAGFGGKSLAEDLPTLLDILQDALRTPILPADHVERLRGQIMTALGIRQHDTRYRAGRAFRELAYAPGHPYHHPSGGRLETIPAITREMLLNFHRTHYGPRGLIIVVVGAVKAEAAL